MTEHRHMQHKPYAGSLNDGGFMVVPSEYGGFAVMQHRFGSMGIMSPMLACFASAHEAALWIEDALTRHEFGPDAKSE